MNLTSQLVRVWGLAIMGGGLLAARAEPENISLPPPQTDGGRPLMQTLAERRSTREFRPDPLSPQMLSNLLWAGFGINRSGTGDRTAPSAMNSQEIDLYVVTADGAYRYDARSNQLHRVVAGNLRPKTGGQDFVKQAPLALVFVADLSRMVKARPEDRERYAGIDTGYVSQNIYLFCASERLASVAHETDRAKLGEALKLGPEQRVILAQSVGYPKMAATTR